MSIHHHPDFSSLISYAAGSLPDSLTLVIASHLFTCEQCQKVVAEAEQLGCVLLNEQPPKPMSESARDEMLTLLDHSAPEPGRQPFKGNPGAEIPLPLQSVLGESFDDLHWKTMAPGMKQFILPCGEGSLRLLKISPGVCMPAHGHTGSELTIVLKGSYSDELGRFRTGDVADLDPDIRHQPLVDSSEECICLVATDAPLKFIGLIPGLLQPFFRI